jgi:hypothetical protein
MESNGGMICQEKMNYKEYGKKKARSDLRENRAYNWKDSRK